MIIIRLAARPARPFKFSTQCLPRKRHFGGSLPRRDDPADTRASSKLFADAEREEEEETLKRTKPRPLPGQNENWTGDESMEDAVLRMLVDKYKPLRSGSIRSAEEKLRAAPPKVSSPTTPSFDEGVSSSALFTNGGEATTASVSNTNTTGPFLAGVEGHKPWHTTFTVPSHASASIKLGNFPHSARTTSQPALPTDERALRKEKEMKKRTMTATRLTQAKESTIDYKLGLRGGRNDMAKSTRPNPVSVKGWASIVEERIERARLEGAFKRIEGRGRPIKRFQDETNPFIAREEYLMNRIVQRQGAAPPWVEIQGELESAVTSFRELLKQAWIRRAIRVLTLSQPASSLPTLSVPQITSLRDPEWEERERGYHTTAIDELNALVRKYNGMAPYAVRRPYYSLQSELERAFEESGEDILRGIAARVKAGVRYDISGVGDEDDVRGGGAGAAGDGGNVVRIRDLFRDWFRLAWRR
ncbi:hypothetical protein JAAARDRAFT_117898 [Jaapia argillacea MUCL 33604]|uniref:DnaJ homologue subfamily C member 28 conserved domain-containing protein n=1 Tax=Jaapia argillacea MUCL 33604 TaxID=933084 RepID=A0A067QAX5_9AGAM|nr:hypothetical protein JAAARDRAFT_117898 [Jaapia argillacea MUCL 33604]